MQLSSFLKSENIDKYSQKILKDIFFVKFVIDIYILMSHVLEKSRYIADHYY